MGQAQKRGEVKPGNAVCQLDCFSVTVRWSATNIKLYGANLTDYSNI